jgi:hypothetical protein
MTDEEIVAAKELYLDRELPLSGVRTRLQELGYKSRSINTLRVLLPQHGCPMRRPGRRATIRGE